MEIEIWKDLVGYEGFYQISNLGRIKSLSRIVITKKGVKRNLFGRVLKQFVGSSGYLEVKLTDSIKHKTLRTHCLMAYTFLNHKPSRYEVVVDHKDNNKLNNNLKNLQLITNQENAVKDRVFKSGYCGIRVQKNKYSTKYVVNTTINKKRVYLGTHDTIEEAINIKTKNNGK